MVDSAPPPPAPPSRRRLWVALLPAMVLPFAASLFYFVIIGEGPVAQVIYGATKAFTLVWPLLAVRWVLREPWPSPALGARRAAHLRALPVGLAVGLGIVALIYALLLTPVGAVAVAGSENIRGKTADLGLLEHYWAFAVGLSVAHSLLEEYYWRWFVFGHLSRACPGWRAHGLAALAFAAHHVVVLSQFFPLGWALIFGACVGVGGVIWSFLYRWQGTLAGAWLSHLLVDLGIFALGAELIFPG